VTQQPHYGPTSSWSGFEAVAEDRRIDFVFVNEDVDVVRHGILSETLDGRFPSDHLPVLAEVAVQ
jgi:endonuclease/exonuclease/phosphatase family metal-dependent hydrolase